MSADCLMASSMAASDCPQNCCAHGLAQAIAPPVAAEKLSLPATTPAPALAGITPPADAAAPLQDVATPLTESPPLYLLHRVFRI